VQARDALGGRRRRSPARRPVARGVPYGGRGRAAHDDGVVERLAGGERQQRVAADFAEVLQRLEDV